MNAMLKPFNTHYIKLISLCGIALLLSMGSMSAQTLSSRDEHLQMTFELTEAGIPSYQLRYKEKSVITPSKLGIEVVDRHSFMEGFEISNTEQNSVDTTWELVLGEEKSIRNHYNELLVTLTQPSQGGRFI